jgi:hypothetical protein
LAQKHTGVMVSGEKLQFKWVGLHYIAFSIHRSWKQSTFKRKNRAQGQNLNVGDELGLEPQEKELPRWVRVLAGLVLGLFALLCGFASLSLLLVPDKQAPVLAVIVGLVLILGCLWILEKCFRLITGRKNRGGLMTPNTLQVLSFLLLILPIVGLFTGYYREMGAIAIFQAVMYFFGFLGLRTLARKREGVGDSGDRAKE